MLSTKGPSSFALKFYILLLLDNLDVPFWLGASIGFPLTFMGNTMQLWIILELILTVT